MPSGGFWLPKSWGIEPKAYGGQPPWAFLSRRRRGEGKMGIQVESITDWIINVINFSGQLVDGSFTYVVPVLNSINQEINRSIYSSLNN
jgi:hypothetical protein